MTEETEATNRRVADLIDRRTRPGKLFRPEDGKVRCLACSHKCLIPNGGRGVCKLRSNADGTLMVPADYVVGLASDPVEKKPFFHLLPGNNALTFGMLGCNFHCPFCQNWLTSQALREEASMIPVHPITSEQMVATAVAHGDELVVSSYNEPFVTVEWAGEVFEKAVQEGLLCAAVSNGYASEESLDFLGDKLTACKVDLKAFNPETYKKLGGDLGYVTDTIRSLHRRGIWLEIVTLLVPGFNDDEKEITELTQFIASVSKDIPWHVTAFHQDYKMTGNRNTSGRDLLKAAQIGRNAGLRFVYAGNMPGRVEGLESTYCPECNELLVERSGFFIRQMRITRGDTCPNCGTVIPGIWYKK